MFVGISLIITSKSVVEYWAATHNRWPISNAKGIDPFEVRAELFEMDVKNWKISLTFSALVVFLCFLAGYSLRQRVFISEKVAGPRSGGPGALSEQAETTATAGSNSNQAVTQEVPGPNLIGVSDSIAKKGSIHKPFDGRFASLEHGFTDVLPDVVPSITVDFIEHDPEAFGQYSQLLSEARRSGSEESITELLDLALAFLGELIANEATDEKVLFTLDFCEKIRDDLKTFETTLSPEFMQISRARILLTERCLTRERSTLLDLGTAQEEFHNLTEMHPNDPVLERQRRYLLFLAQTEGLYSQPKKAHEDWGGYYDYNILRDVLELAPVSPALSIRKQITAAKINIAAKLEYARRNFISSSKDIHDERKIINDEEVLARYNETLARYAEALCTLDSLPKDFRDKLSAGDKRYIAVLKQRFANDRRRVPWRYTYY